MLFHFRFQNNYLSSFFQLNSLTNQTKPRLTKTLTLTPTMAAEPSSKRATCHSCSKPLSLCLCTRIKYPNLNNSIAIIVLQHSLEQNHPLNSTRIAALGLKNLKIVPVFDVHFEARFRICPIRPNSEMGFDCFEEGNNGSKEKSVLEKAALGVGNLNAGSDLGAVRSIRYDSGKGFACIEERNNGSEEKSVFERIFTTFVVGKRGGMSPDFDMLLGIPVVLDALAKGFIVKKWQNKLLNGSITQEEFKEFEIVVPPGSALLFPSENSVGIEAIDFEVKNLIVLDGTWSKAKRIYSENPWLKVLPHLRLDLDKMSLYSEVRRQPRVGYLSTLESIVYAMKGLGDETDGLFNLLEVFESMVGDQRRCKDERLRNFSSIDTHLSKHITALDNV